MSNAWITCLLDWDNPGKLGLIPDKTTVSTDSEVKGGSSELSPLDGSMSHQVVGEVTAHQA